MSAGRTTLLVFFLTKHNIREPADLVVIAKHNRLAALLRGLSGIAGVAGAEDPATHWPTC